MQVLLPTAALVPVGAGVIVVVVVLVALLVRARRRRRRAAASGDAAAVSPDRPTVAHAVAIREADTAPLPISSATVLARSEAARAAGAVPVEDLTGADAGSDVPGPDADDPGRAAPDAVDEASTTALPLVKKASEAEPPDVEAPRPEAPEAVAEPVAQPQEPQREAAGAPDTAGSNAAFASAVSQVLAARAAAGVGPAPDAPAPPPPVTLRGDARDRLLAVLLDDPARAVGAAHDLESVTVQLARLRAAVTHERAVLGTVLGRLSAAGLRPEQVAQLSGIEAAEVDRLLGER